MKTVELNFKSDLRISVGLVNVLLLAVGSILVLTSWPQVSMEQQLRLLYAAMPFLFVAGLAWVMDAHITRFAPAFVVIALNLGVCAASWTLHMPELLVSLGVITVLTAGLLGVIPAAANAAGETLILLLLAQWLPPSPFIFVTLLLIWTLWGAMLITYHPVEQLAAWLWRYFEQARALTLQSREQRMQLAQSLQDYKHASRQLALAGERATGLRQVAEEAQRAKAQFVARVSHELRAPLNIIIGLVELMVENPTLYAEELPPELRRDLTIVHRNCRYLSNLVNDVLDLSRTEAGRMQLHQEHADMANIIQSSLDIVRPLVDKKGLRLVADIPDGIRVYCDPVRIRQVLLNLVSNAARFTEEGHIHVSLAKTQQHVVISVCDTGPGINPEDIKRIFEPFYQTGRHLEQTSTGSGLGLSISKALVERHGGRIWVESRTDAGTCFFFNLPSMSEPRHLERAGHQIVENWVWREPAFRTDRTVHAEELMKPRWLVYDEAGGLHSQLLYYSDHVEFIEVDNLTEAADELVRYAAHGMLLNTTTPAHLLKRLQEARAEIAETPVIGCGVAPLIQSVLDMGAQGYLLKPVTPKDLDIVFETVASPIRRILVTDDEVESARVLAQLLRARDPTLEVWIAYNGNDALTKAQELIPDVILLDVMMPNMDGWQTLEAIRTSDLLEEIPVFFVSAQNPESSPPRSEWLVATTAGGISIKNLVYCSLDLATRLREQAQVPDPARAGSPDTESAWASTD